MKSSCIRCNEPFEHPPGRYTVCPECRRAASRAAKKRWANHSSTATKSIASDHDENFLRRLCVRSATEVSEICGLSRDQVLRTERQAIRKLREHKHQLEEVRSLSAADDRPVQHKYSELDLLDFQISVGEWWALADHLAAVGKTSERDECIAQIGRFQRKISEYLNNAVS
ncbi:MAG TPA: hypothetical protein VGY56_17395 [Verrucomicrobiae bacterium]|nr:hypothetical protein [Verrucomicrobiae bacterium]